MKHRYRNFLIISASMMVLLAVLMLIARVVMLQSFLQIEEASATEHIERIHVALQNEVDHLDSVCSDYARSNDAYRFINGSYPEYVRLDLSDDSLSKLGLNFVTFIAPDGEEVYSKVVNLQGVTFNPYTFLRPALLKGAPLFDLQRGTKGYLVAGGTPILVSSRPVLTSEGSGPPAGILIVGRLLNAVEIGHLGNLVRLPLKITPINTSLPGTPLPQEFRLLGPEHPLNIKRQSEELLTGHHLFADISNKPAFVISATIERSIYRQGVETIRQAMLFAFAAMLLAILIINRLTLKIAFSEKSRLITEVLYNYVVEESRAAALLLEAENCRIIKCTSGFSRLLGYTPEQLEGVLFRELIAGNRDEFERCRTTALEDSTSATDTELQLCRRDQTEQTCTAVMTLKMRDDREFLLLKLILPRS